MMNRNLQHCMIAGAMALALGMNQWAAAQSLPITVSARISGDVRKISNAGSAQDGAVIALPAGSVVTFSVTISNGVPLTVTLPPTEKLQGTLSELMDGGGDSITVGNAMGKQISLGDVKGVLGFALVGMSTGVSRAKAGGPETLALSTDAKSADQKPASGKPVNFGPFDLDLTKVVDLSSNAGLSVCSQQVRANPTSKKQVPGFNVDMQKVIETLREAITKQ